ncbi:MAG: type II toxin-antitoxin system Phd/YefM family antitoxin [Kiritimatiellaeota bacterium]|nr:type II toxin-antitoxin system Phd/YefM family antitoxin [Kiritimatiellota bacterium]
MKDIGIRELKKRASELVRHVAEEHATYMITRRGRPVGVLVPPDFVQPKRSQAGDAAWTRLEELWTRVDQSSRPRKSALSELAKMRRYGARLVTLDAEQLERAPEPVGACKPEAAISLLRTTVC